MSKAPQGLTADQQKALNSAIDLYVIANMRLHGGIKAKPVILIPSFEEDNGEWIPVQSNGIRPTKKDELSFMRFGMPTVSITSSGTPEVKVLKTNVFNDDSKLELLVATYDLKIGDSLPDTVLVVEESLNPFSQSNPDQHLKVAGSTGIPCTFIGEHQGITYDTAAPIYRRVKLAPAGTQSTFIQHTNVDEIRKAMELERAQNAPKANSTSIKNAATVAGRKK